jgi:hypothetical protein
MKLLDRLLHRPHAFSGSPAPGVRIHEWKVLQHLGKARNGTFFEVERARRRSVLKWLAPGLEMESVVRGELACLRRLGAPIFAQLEAHGRWPDDQRGGSFLILEHVPGVSLLSWYSHSGASPHELVRVFERIAEAMVFMHYAGVRYPRLTCEDVKVRAGSLEPVIVDLGGATAGLGPVSNEESTEDVRGIGAMLYEVMTRQQPGPIIIPPHVINPRIPLILSDLAMFLLAP